MKKKALYITLYFLIGVFAYGQECPELNMPTNGATNVSVGTTISWEAVTGVPSYLISMGTQQGGTDIADNVNVGNLPSYTPPVGLPEATEIFVTITLFFFNAENIDCQIGSFTTEDVTTPAPCTTLSSPVNGAENVNIASNISWNAAPTATGYRLTVRTIMDGVLYNEDVNNVLSFNPPVNLPNDTEVFVQITPYNENGDLAPCTEESFTTQEATTILTPGCTSLISPANGSLNVPLTPLIQWNPVPGADSYKVSIGSDPFNNNILDDAIFNTTQTTVIEFEPNRTFFITIIPFNEAGDAINCTQESFSTILGCASFFDPISGDLVSSIPEITVPDEIGICENEPPTLFTSTDVADGFRWFIINRDGTETLLSQTSEVALSEAGEYRYEAFNIVGPLGNTFECPATSNFRVVSSEIAEINAVNVSGQATGVRLEVVAIGIGDYEYALDNIDGPYQDSNIFNGVTPGTHIVYVRDKAGCGIAKRTVVQDLTLDGFPNFFTPNGDGINDFWQFIPPSDIPNDSTIVLIRIFDRFGNFIAQIDPQDSGWDGTFNGRELPATDYWFSAQNDNNEIVRGHFALKR